MITGITIKNFKSLANFSMSLDQFSCLIGLNGAGKTTVLQALDLIGHFACGETDFRGWEKKDLITNGSSVRTLIFQIDFLCDGQDEYDLFGEEIIDKSRFISWLGKYNIDKQKFVEERIFYTYSQNLSFLSLKDNILSYTEKGTFFQRFIYDNEDDKDDKDSHFAEYFSKLLEEKNTNQLSENRIIREYYYNNKHITRRSIADYNYTGSILFSFLFTNPIVVEIKNGLQSMKSLELLSPRVLRHVSQKNNSMGLSGEGLPGFLSSMKETDAQRLVETLGCFYPDVLKYEIKHKKFGWKDLLIREAYLKNPVPAMHVNDGYLRILAMLSQKYSNASFLLFDEIENGINQELIEKLLTELQNFNGKQVLVTTHSALVLNYLTDEAAQKSVIFLFKDSEGHTHARKFFEIPEIAEKMEFMAPGQIMSQTNLNDLSRKLSESMNANKDA